MDVISWSSEYSVGIGGIDDQHKKLVSILNALLVSLNEDTDPKHISGLLKELADYSIYHFDNEERYMKEFDYPLYAEHHKEHEDFKAKIMIFIDQYEKQEAMLTVDLLEFVWNWLKGHIAGTDKKYSAFFREHGLK